MTQFIRLAERPAAGSCEDDYGLTFDLVSAEASAISKAVAARPSHLDELASTIETAIIPRLLLSHGMAGPAMNDLTPFPAGGAIGADGVRSFADLILGPDNGDAFAMVEALMREGADVESVLLGLLGPAARLLGDMWSADLVSFVDVTLGLARIQQVLRQLRGLTDGREVAEPGKGRALLLAVPGEQHTLGLRVAEEFLLRDGWQVRSSGKADAAEIGQLASEEHYDLVGFSISGGRLLPALQSAIRDVRKCSRNRTVRIMVGGVLVLEQSNQLDAVDADAVIRDAREAVAKANEWYAPAAVN